MQKQEKSRKPLIIGIIAAVVILAVLLVLLLTQCTGGQGGGSSTPATEDTSDAVPTYQLYWNADRAEYDGKSEAGMSSRMPEEDGYFHVRFILDGEELILKVADRKLINAIDVQDVMGLEFDEDGIVIGVLNLDDMPLEKVGWQFYVQSAARTMIKLNSSESMNGMEVLLEDLDPNRIWDMSGKSGPVGVVDEAIELDKIMAIQNLAGEVTHVFIFERPNYMLSHEGYCEHCKETVVWSEWVKGSAMPMLSGHYQLQTDVQLSGQASLPEDCKMCLDLNGHRIDGKQSGGRAIAMFNPAITLAIMDTSEEQTGVVAAHGKVDQGGVVWVRYGALYLYGGTLDASDATTQKGGTAVECGNGKFFYMYGGTIIGGTATYTYNAEKNTYGAGYAGALSIGGKFVMNGGEIRDGHAEAAVIYKDGKISSYQRGFGGNLYLSSTAEFEMNGGTIKNGKAGGAGGNIYADGAATLTINGGTISGGYLYGKGKNGGNMFLGSKTTTDFNSGSIYGGVSYNCGGNVYLNGTLNMNGGYIGGGVCYNFDTRKVKPTESSANLFVVNGKLTMWGGTIAGGVSAIDSKANGTQNAVISLYGVARIDGSTVNRNLTISGSGDGVKVIVGNMYKGAKIGVNTTIGLFTEPTKEEYKQYFYSDIEGAEILYYQERLALGRLNCICGKSHNETVSETHINGCDSELLLWAPWTSTSSIPTTTGNYFLLNDITTKSQTVVYGGNDVKVDLNGKNITLKVQTNSRDGWRLYRADNGAKLAITDTTEKPGTLQTVMPAEDAVYTGGKFTVEKTIDGEKVKIEYTKDDPEGQAYVKSLWEKGNFGMLLWALGGEITVHNGIFDGSNLTGAQNGMLVSVGNNTVTDEETGEKTVYVGKLDMYNGTIIGGYTRAEGNIRIANGSVMNLYGGTITGGRANVGGNINVLGTLNMYGGTVTKGVVDRSHEEVDGGMGGNISIGYTNAKVYGVVNMYGGVVSDGYVKAGQKGGGHGGNFHVYGVLNATGGEIRGGVATGAGGNIGTIGAYSTITLDGVKVLDGKAASGGNVAVNVRTNKGLYLLGDTVISDGHATATANAGGGNVSINLWINTIDQDQIVVIDGATISDGTAAGNAGNLYVRNTTANRIVKDEKTGKEKQDRYEVAVDVTMKSGTISGGMNGVKADGTRGKFNGGSIYMTSKTSFTLENGTITGGDTSDVGGCVYTNGLLTVKGGTISGGTTKGKVAGSSNVAVVNGTLAMSGGVIDGNATITSTKPGLAKVQLSGKPVVKQNVVGLSLSYYNGTQPLIDIDGELEEGASVAVTGSGYISTETPETNLKYFSSKSDTIIHYNKCMFIGRALCICGKSHGTTVSETHINGCDGTVYAWERWGSTSSIPTRSGNFYLGADVTTKSQTVVAVGKDIKLDLNGKNITLQVQPSTQDGFRLYRVEDGSKLAITDTTGEPGTLKTVMPGEDAVYPGKTTNTKASTYDDDGNIIERVYFTEEEMRAAWAKGNGGMLLWVRGGKVTIHNAILDGSNLEGANGGMVVNVSSNTVTTTVIDPETNEETEEKTVYYGELNMYNGTIIGGFTKASGNIAISYGSTMNMFGGTITGGRAYVGGNIHVAGTLNLYDGLITKGLIDRSEEAVDAGSGGNINIDTSGVVNMLGGQVTDGTAIGGNGGVSGGHGGNFHVYGKLNATGGTISGGETKGGGGNIATIGANSRIVLDGVAVKDGKASRGGNVCVNVRVNRELTITEKTVISGGEASNGGNIAVSVVNGQGNGRAGENAMIVRIEGEVKGGTATGAGGNIHITNAVQTEIGDKPAKKQDEIKVTISGTSITDGEGGNGSGGNIYLYNVDTEITNTKILNGTLTRKNAGHANGGNIYAGLGTLKLVGCTIDKGVVNSAAATATQSCYARGGNVFVENAELTIDSTVISNGTTHGTGANGRAYAGNLHLSKTTATIDNDSKIIDGKTTREGTGWSPAGNLYIEGGSTVTITDTEISGGNGTSSCNNIYLNTTTDTLTLGNGAVVRNTVTGSKVNICYRGGTLNVKEGALITNDEGIACRNIGYIAEADAEFNMSGGKIEGGDTTTFVDNENKANGYGANLHFTTHKNKGEIVFTMTGGEIVGGRTNTNGGNVYSSNPGNFTMSGGTVKDGSSKGTGGNMYFAGTGTITLSGGTVSGGHAVGSSNNGGNISVSHAATVTLKGDVQVIDGIADNCGGNIYVNGDLEIHEDALVSGGTAKNYKNIFAVNGQIVMSGGEVDGGLQLTTTDAGVNGGDLAKITLSGAPVITKDHNGLNFSATSEPIEIIGTLAEGAEIWVSNTGIVSGTTVAENVPFVNHVKAPAHNTYFTDDAMVTAGIDAEDKGKLFIGQYHCVCGASGTEHLGTCGGTKLVWKAWTASDKLPTTAGNYYLATNVSTAANEVAEADAKYALTLDLNGFEIKSTSGRMYRMYTNQKGVDLTITDTAAVKGKIYSTERTYDQGAIIWAPRAAHTVKLYNVTIDGSDLTLNNKAYLSGVVLSSSGDLSLYGSTSITGGDSVRGPSAIEISSTAELRMDLNVPVNGEIYVGDNAKIVLDGLEDASVYTVNASGVFTVGNTITDEAKFFKSSSEAEILLEDGEQFAGHTYCICGQTDHPDTCGGEMLNWRPYRSDSDIPHSAHNWYLTKDVVRTCTNTLKDNAYNAAGTYNLNLNGKTIQFKSTLGGYRAFRFNVDNVTIGITDLDQTGKPLTTGKVEAHISKGGQDGTIFWLRKATNVLNIYGGTFDAANVVMANDDLTTTANETKAAAVLRLSAGTVNMYGGTIQNGKSGTGDISGGNVVIDDNAVMNMYGGTIQGGKSLGGVSPSSNGKIWGGYGGNVLVTGTLNMYGGQILDGEANKGANVCLNARNENHDGTLNMYGGMIAGGVEMEKRTTNGSVGMPKVLLSGTPVINKEKTSDTAVKPAISLSIASGVIVDATGIMDGAEIHVTGTGKFGITVESNGAVAQNAFHSETDDEIYLHNKTELHFAKSYCLCGANKTDPEAMNHIWWCDHADEGNHKWIEWDGSAITASGHYYLTGKKNVKQVQVGGDGMVVVLDLNGEQVQYDYWRCLHLQGGVFSITDTAGGGQISGCVDYDLAKDHSGTLLTAGNLVINLYNGTITAAANSSPKSGGVVSLGANRVFNMYGGTISGGNAAEGGNIKLENGAVFNLYGGTVSGGTGNKSGITSKGGNFYVGTSAAGNQAVLNVLRHTKDTEGKAVREISGGNATEGGNIYVAGGKVNILDGTVTGGTASKGGNIYVSSGEVNVDGENAKVEYGLGKYKANGATSAFGQGGNVYTAGGEFNLLNGASVAYGSVASENDGWAPGGNFYVHAGTVNVTGATISNGQNVTGAQNNAKLDGTNLYINYDAQVNLNTGAVVENNFDVQESILVQGGKLTLDGGKIYNAEGVTAANGIVTNTSCLKDRSTNTAKWPTIEILSGEIYGAKINLSISGGTTVTMAGGSIHSPVEQNVMMNNRASYTKDGVTYTGDAVFNMTGGKVYGGNSAANGGNFVLMNNAKLDVSGSAEIYNGTAKHGGNIYLGGSNSKLSVYGEAKIYGGTANEGSGGNINLAENKNAIAFISGAAKVYDGTNTYTGTGSKPNGGSIWVGKTATITLEGEAEVYGGTTCNGGGNFYNNGTIIVKDSAKIYNAGNSASSANIFNVGGTLDIQGGSIAGGVRVHTGTIKLSGAPVINKELTTVSTKPSASLSLNTTNVVADVSGLTGGEIYVSADKIPAKIGTNAASSDVLNYIKSEYKYGNTVVPVAYVENDPSAGIHSLYLGHPANTYCVCGATRTDAYTCQCGENDRVWVQWDGYNLPTATGNYYLVNDLTPDQVLTPDKGAKIAIDLRGHTITLDAAEKLYELPDGQNATIILTDSSEDALKIGSVIKTGESDSDGGMLIVREGSTFEMYRVTLNGSGFDGIYTSDSAYQQGGVLAIFNGGSVIMHSGTIMGAETCEGGAVFLYGAGSSMTMKSGTISGGTTTRGSGGNIIISKGCSFTMENGEITSGCAYTGKNGGNIYVSGEGASFTMKAGTISGGTAAQGGNIFVTNKASFTMEDGNVNDGVTTATGGNIFAESSSVLTMNAGTISGGKAATGGGNIRLATSATFTMKGGSIIGGTSTGSDAGGNIRMTYKSTFIMEGGLVKDGSVGDGGGYNDAAANFYVQHGTLEVSGGQIYGGIAMHYVDSWADSSKSPARLILSGTPVIDGRLNVDAVTGRTAARSVELWGTDSLIAVEEALQNGSAIGIHKAGGKLTDFLFSTANADVNEASKGYFFADNGAQNIYVINDAIVADCEEFTDEDLGKLYVGQVHCVCGGLVDHGADNKLCDSKLHVWTAKTEITELTLRDAKDTSYFWYLSKSLDNVNKATSIIPNVDGTTASNVHIYLDLNGFDLGLTGGRLFVSRSGVTGATVTGCSVNVVNTSGNTQKSTITMKNKHDQGSLIWVSQGATARIFNVRIASSITNTGSHYGGVVSVGGTGSSLYMDSVDYVGSYTQASGYNASVVSLNTSGEIHNSTFTGAWDNMGAIYLAGSNLLLDNCTVTGNRGGGVYAHRGTLTLAGKTTITGNTAEDGTANYNLKVDTEYKADGVTVNGRGSVVLADGFSGSFGLCGDADRALIKSITTWDNAIYTGGKITVDDADNQQIMIWDEGLGLTSKANIIQCACGGKAAGVGDHQCKKLVFTPWTDSTKLPTIAGNYYLSNEGKTVDLAATWTPNKDATINLDLNGHVVNAPAGNARLCSTYNRTGVTISVTDHAGDGMMKATNELKTDEGGIFWLASNANLNLYAGTLDGNGHVVSNACDKAKGTSSTAWDAGDNGTVAEKNGGLIAVPKGATFKMYGGTVQGGTTGKREHTVKDAEGNDLKLTPQYSAHGGNVAVSGTMYMYGGTIQSGNSDGDAGNVYVTGTFVMTGGTIQDGTAGNNGGNMRIHANGSVKVSDDALIKDGKAINWGGNIISDGKLEINGATVQDGFAGNPNGAEGLGGNIYGGTSSDITVTSAQIKGGFTVSNAKNNAGELTKTYDTKNGWNRCASIRAAGKFAVSNSTINGSVYFDSSAVVTISGNTKIDQMQGISVTDSNIASITFKDLGADAKFKIYLNANLKNNYSDTTGDPFAVIEGTATTSVFTVPASFTIVDGKVFLVN